MDNLKLQEEISGLKKLSEHLESQLKLVSLELCDLPDDVLLLVDKCVEIQAQSQLHELNLNYLREFYFIHKRESIENQLTAGQQTAALIKLRNSLETTEKDIDILANFNKKSQQVIEDAALKRNISAIEGKTKALLDRQKNLKVPEEFNIEAMMDKVETLERLKKGEKK